MLIFALSMGELVEIGHNAQLAVEHDDICPWAVITTAATYAIDRAKAKARVFGVDAA